jgi:predicted DsbA family dithiol-disulfide isomerase
VGSRDDASDRRVRLIGVVVVAVVVAVILGAALWSRGTSAGYSDEVLPQGVRSDFGVSHGSPNPDAPTLEVWADFQCPACGQLEALSGQAMRRLSDAGRINLIWRPTAFLDASPGVRQANEANGAPESSARAISAWGCAIDAGYGDQFHEALFEFQASEGRGYPDVLLKGLGERVGISGIGMTTFQTCVDEGTYLGWARNATIAFREAGIAGTPTVLLNGREIPLDQAADANRLEQLIEQER